MLSTVCPAWEEELWCSRPVSALAIQPAKSAIGALAKFRRLNQISGFHLLPKFKLGHYHQSVNLVLQERARLPIIAQPFWRHRNPKRRGTSYWGIDDQTHSQGCFSVAGLGTRFLPATKSIPKEMLTVVDRPVLQHVVEEAREAGMRHFIFVTGRNKAVIEDHFDISYELDDTLKKRGKLKELQALTAELPAPGAMSFTRQQVPLGLGHAVWCAGEIVATSLSRCCCPIW